jgi:hypothetical protein
MATTPGKKRSVWLAGAAAVLAVAACTGAPAPGPGNVTAAAAATAAAPETVVHGSGVEVPTSTAAGSFPATFIGISTGTRPISSRLAVYSAANGRVLKYLTAAAPGVGRFASLELSADGGTVVFGLFGGTCTAYIDTVPAGGGAERVLIPPAHGDIPFAASYSADGKYLIYGTVVPCPPPYRYPTMIHVRNLRTGHELAGPGALGWDAVFVNDDRQVVFVNDAGLTVLQLPSLRAGAYPAPRGCRYQGLAGTETELDALLQCGPGHELSVVAISPRTFTVTKTLIRLGSCLGGDTISLAPADPSAILAETYDACLSAAARATLGDNRIVKIRAGQAWLVTSGHDLPEAAFW